MGGDHEAIVVHGTTWCPGCKRAKQFLGDQRIHYHLVDIEQDPEAMATVERINHGKHIIPTIVFTDGSVLVEPSNAELAEKLALTAAASRTSYDIVIVGGRPAGLTAAIYAAREGLDTLVIERAAPGGQAAVTQVIDDYPGFDKGISGDEFADRPTRQTERFGVEILEAREVNIVRTNGRYREVLTADGTCYAGRAVLIAAGARYRRLNIDGESELIGVSVHFCATCDGAFYKGKEVLVVGGGTSAFEESLFLTGFATHGPEIRAGRILQERIAVRDDMTVVRNRDVQQFVVREGKLVAVRVLNRGTGEAEEWHLDGVFVFIGVSPNSEFLPPEIERDREGFVLTGDTMQTSIKGVFAAGDVRAGATAQAASAAGEGATVALMMRDYLRHTA